MKKTCFFIVFFSLFLAIVTAQGAEKEYIIEKGDALSIRVWGEDSLSTDTVVRPDGKISLPGVGNVQAAGLTTSQLQGRITGHLKSLVYEPMVSVDVHTFPNNSMVVYGPGTKSLLVPLTGKTTILQILSQIQPDNNADLVNAYVERGNKRIASNFDDLFRKGEGGESNIEILAGDRLFIPLTEARLVFVEGAVGKPSSLPYHKGMTVLEAIHLAGGFTKFADRNSVTITRKIVDGKDIFNVRLHDFITQGDFSQNVPVQGGDIIFVKASWF